MLTPVGVTIFTGGWSEFAAAREARREAAAGALDKAETDLRRVKDQVQLQREMKQRKDAAGKAGRFAAGQSKMLLDFKQERAEASQGAANRLADRQLSEANEALDKVPADEANGVREWYIDIAQAVDGVVAARVDGLARDDLRSLAVAVRDRPGVRAVGVVFSPEMHERVRARFADDATVPTPSPDFDTVSVRSVGSGARE